MTSIPSVRTSASSPCGPYDEVSTNTSGSTGPIWPTRRQALVVDGGPARRRRRRRAATGGTASVHRRRATPTRLPAAPARRTRRRAPTTTAPPPRTAWDPGARTRACQRARRRAAPPHGVPAVRMAQQRGGQLHPDERSAQQLGEPGQVRLLRRDRRPGREVARQVERGAVPGVDERACLLPRQRLDPEGAERLTHASPMPALRSCSMRRPVSWSPGRNSYAGCPWVTSCRSRRYGARVRRRSCSRNGSGHRCWCRSTANMTSPYLE